MAEKPAFVQETFDSTNPGWVADRVNTLVNKLNEEGYTVKVIVHGPVVNTTTNGAGLNTDISFMTTVIATLSGTIDIGLSLPG